MASQIITDAEYIQASGQDDPDLNQAFYDFADQIKSEANSGGSIAVFEVPVDANGTARPTTYNKTKLFTVPVGAVTVDDICDRVLREFVEPGGKIMIQLLARKDGERGVKLNRLIPLRRGKLSADAPTGQMGEIAQMLRMMNEQRGRERAELIELLSRNNAQAVVQVDPMERALAIADRIAALSAKSQAPAANPNDPMQQLMQMMMARMMKKFFEMDGEKDKSSDNSTDWMKHIAELARPLLAAKAASEETAKIREQRMLQHEKTLLAAPASAPTASSDATPPETPTPTKEDIDMKLLAMLGEALPQVIEFGPKKETPPLDVAKIVMDGLPEDDKDLNDALFALIQSPPDEFVRKLAVVDIRVKEFPEWFEEFRVALLNEFEPDRPLS